MSTVYHRRVRRGSEEEALVRRSGKPLGRSPSVIAGGGPPRVSAYVGRLPADADGYAFETKVEPTNRRLLFGEWTAEWREGSTEVRKFSSTSDTVFIEVTLR